MKKLDMKTEDSSVCVPVMVEGKAFCKNVLIFVVVKSNMLS